MHFLIQNQLFHMGYKLQIKGTTSLNHFLLTLQSLNQNPLLIFLYFYQK